MLAIDSDRPTCQIPEIDAMATPAEAQFDAIMNQAFALQPVPDAHLNQQVHRTPFEHARPDALFTVLAAAVLQDHRINALQVQQVREHQPCRARSHDADLRAYLAHFPAFSGWRCPKSSGLLWSPEPGDHILRNRLTLDRVGIRH